ncbi:MAG TPA: PLP-dependent aminotransferase family protein [Terriglobales bacterium]|nr:PLP-dependent aminotransferase family protein [Terriglobales bacterium]
MKRISSGISPVIAVDRNATSPLYRQVYDAYRAAIMEGRLRAGERVPSTRALALELGVSRIPILNAHAQLLAEGYFESRVGAGTVISRSLPDQMMVSESRGRRPPRVSPGPRPLSARTVVSSSVETGPWHRGWGAFGVSQVAFDHFPFPVWNSLVTRHCRNTQPKSFDYGHPLGSKDLREEIASYLRTARAVRCEADQIMIVSGSQQALQIATFVLLDARSKVWMEEPGYRFARAVFASSGCEIVPVPVDSEGLNVAAGIKRCPKARLAMVSPSHQYPLGVTMSASRRLQLLEWAESSGSWVIEDDYDSEYRYESMPIASLQGLDANSRVIYVGTFSKVLFPSLRLGYVVVPPDLVPHFIAVRLALDIAPPGFFQGVLADFIREGHFSRHIRRMRILYNERRRVLIDSIDEEFGERADVTGGQAGLHLSMALKGISDLRIATRAAEQKLWLVPLSSSYLETPSRHGFILGFGSTSAEDMPKAVRKLRSLLVST